MENLAFLGIILIMAGFLLLLASSTSENVEAGGVIFLGPIPIPFGSRRIWLPLVIVGFVLIGAFYFLTSRPI